MVTRFLRRQRGVTLPELMVTLTVMGILAAMAAPSYSTLVASMRGRAVSSNLHTALARARSEAIKRNAEVSLEPVRDSGWQHGWSIRHPSDADTTLDRHGAMPGATVSGPASVVFLPNGRVKGGDLPKFDIAVTGSEQHRCVALDLSGRPNLTNAEC